jgi:hypothetical protein
MRDEAEGSQSKQSPPPPHASSYPDDIGRRRRSAGHHHAAGVDQSQARKDRDSTHSGTSSRRLLRLLIEEEYQSGQLRKLLSTACDRIEAETRRATEAERLVQESSRLNEAKLSAEQDAIRANQQLSLCTQQLDNANREIQSMRERLSVIEGQRNEAEQAAAKARATARKLNEQRLVQIAREEGRRVGFEAGFVRGQRLGYEAARASAYEDGPGELPQVLSRPLLEGPPDPPQQTTIAEDAASIRSTSPSAVRPPVILETDFSQPRLADFDSSVPTTTMADVEERGRRHPETESPSHRTPHRTPEGIFQPQPLRIITPSLYEPVPGPSRLSSSRTPPIQVYTVDIPPHHELEQEPPPSSSFTSPPAVHQSTPPDTRPTNSGPPPPSNLSRSNTFGFLSRRVRPQRPLSNDTSQFDAANRPRRHSLSAVPENAAIGNDFNADAHRASAIRQSQSSGAETNTSGRGLIPRRLSKMIKKLAGSMERNSTDRHSNKVRGGQRISMCMFSDPKNFFLFFAQTRSLIHAGLLITDLTTSVSASKHRHPRIHRHHQGELPPIVEVNIAADHHRQVRPQRSQLFRL